jgi:hypothetical protein
VATQSRENVVSIHGRNIPRDGAATNRARDGGRRFSRVRPVTSLSVSYSNIAPKMYYQKFTIRAIEPLKA